MRSRVLQAAHLFKMFWIQAGLCVVFLLVADMLLRIGLSIRDFNKPDLRVHADAYRNPVWARKYFADLAGFRVHWFPYSYWIGRQYRSRYINVGKDGLRATYSQPLPPGGKPIRLFMFGGSAMWGEGSPDDDTIPSWIQRMLDGTARAIAKRQCPRPRRILRRL
jgi:hypothetical protein